MRRRSDALRDPEGAVRRVYAYVAHRVGPGARAEKLTRELLTRKAGSHYTDVSVIASARQAVDERFGPSDRDRELVALNLAGLDMVAVAAVLGFRREAVAVALRRAGARLESVRTEPRPEFVDQLVDEIRATRRPTSQRRRRMLKVAVFVSALVVAVPAFGALVGDHTPDPVLEPLSPPRVAAAPRATRSKPATKPVIPRGIAKSKAKDQTTHEMATSVAPKGLIRRANAEPKQATQKRPASCVGREALRAGHQQAQAKMLERQIREKVEGFSRLAERYPEPRFARTVLRKRTALERRLYAEWKALLAKQSREARALQACLG